MKKKLICILLVFILLIIITNIVRNHKQQKGSTPIQEKENYEEQVGEYKIVYNNMNFMFELYDKFGNLIITTPDKESCEHYVENPDMAIDISNF